MKSIRLAALPAIALAAAALTGCGKKDSVEAKNESVEAVAKKVADSDIKPRPGRWETSIQMGKVEMEGMPAAAAQAMSQQAGSQRGIATCLTPEQVAQMSDGGMFKKMPGECKYNQFTMAGGKIDGQLTCANGPQKYQTTMTGTYAADAYNVKMATETDLGEGRSMKMNMDIQSHRVGECNGTEVQNPNAGAAK